MIHRMTGWDRRFRRMINGSDCKLLLFSFTRVTLQNSIPSDFLFLNRNLGNVGILLSFITTSKVEKMRAILGNIFLRLIFRIHLSLLCLQFLCVNFKKTRIRWFYCNSIWTKEISTFDGMKQNNTHSKQMSWNASIYTNTFIGSYRVWVWHMNFFALIHNCVRFT